MNITKRKHVCHQCKHYAKFKCNASVFKKCGDKFPWKKLAACPKDKWLSDKPQ